MTRKLQPQNVAQEVAWRNLSAKQIRALRKMGIEVVDSSLGDVYDMTPRLIHLVKDDTLCVRSAPEVRAIADGMADLVPDITEESEGGALCNTPMLRDQVGYVYTSSVIDLAEEEMKPIKLGRNFVGIELDEAAAKVEKAPAKSTGHIGFAHGMEYYWRNGELYRAPINNPVFPDGFRCGRWHSNAHCASYYLQQVGLA